MTPLYLEPAVGLSSTVAFSVFVFLATALYAASNSSRVASFATGLSPCGITVRPLTVRPWQPQEIAASVAESRHVCTHRINKFRAFTRESSNLTTSREPVNRGGASTKVSSIGPRNVDVELLDRRAHAPDHFAWPKRLAQNRHPAVLRLTDRAKRVPRVGLLVSIQTASRKIAFEFCVGGLGGAPRAETKGFALEALEQYSQLRDPW